MKQTHGSELSLSQEEAQVVQLLRSRGYQTVTIKIQDGQIVCVDNEESVKLKEDEELLNILQKRNFRALTVKPQGDGYHVRIGRNKVSR